MPSAVMPKGVEHHPRRPLDDGHAQGVVPSAVMPKGVEHTNDPAEGVSLLRAVSRDAERR